MARQPIVSALAIRQSTIIYAGDDATARSLLTPHIGAEAVDLRGACAIPFFTNVWYVCHERFQGIRAHPTNYDLFDEVWDNTAG